MKCDLCGKEGFHSRRSLVGHRNWCLKHKDPAYNTRRLMGLRQDLVRVAREAGVPEGFGPPLLVYRERGRYCEKAVMGWTGGYRKDGNPRITWRAALAKLHLKTYGDHYHATLSGVQADVRRVSLEVGRPGFMPSQSVYRRLGRWDNATVLRHMRVRNWNELAKALNLKPNDRFGQHKLTPEQRSEISRRYVSRRGEVKRLADEFGVSATHVRRIAQRNLGGRKLARRAA